MLSNFHNAVFSCSGSMIVYDFSFYPVTPVSIMMHVPSFILPPCCLLVACIVLCYRPHGRNFWLPSYDGMSACPTEHRETWTKSRWRDREEHFSVHDGAVESLFIYPNRHARLTRGVGKL